MEKEKAIAHNLVALAKKRGGSRSMMLRMIMPMLSRENGDRLAEAIKSNDSQEFRRTWDEIRNVLVHKLDKRAHASNNRSWEEIDGIAQAIMNSMLDTAEASADMSNLLTGNAQIPKLTRQLLANGIVTIPTSGSVKDETLRITDMSMSNGSNPTATVKAKLMNSRETLSATGVPAAACSEIVVAALSYVDNIES